MQPTLTAAASPDLGGVATDALLAELAKRAAGQELAKRAQSHNAGR